METIKPRKRFSMTNFIIVFVISAFAFQFISNSVLGPEVRLFPANGDWFPGSASLVAWKSTLAAIIYPIKLVLVGPLSPVFNDPDPAPPILLFAFSLYWTAIASVLYYIISKIFARKKH